MIDGWFVRRIPRHLYRRHTVVLTSPPLHYSNTYCKYSGKVQCTSTSMCRTLSDKGMARDSVGWHCVDRWRHSVRSRTRDTFATPNAILIDSGRECPGVRFRHGVRDCGMFLDSHSTRSPVMLQ